MADDGDPHRPSLDEKLQARLVYEFNEREAREKKQRDALTAQIVTDHGARFQQQAKELGAQDEATQKLAAELIAKELAEKNIKPHLAEEKLDVAAIVDTAIAAEELKKTQEAEKTEKSKADIEKAEQVKAAESLKQQEQEKQARAQAEAKKADSHEAALQEPIPGVMERFAGIMAERQAQRDAEKLTQKGSINNAEILRAAELGQALPAHTLSNDLKQENAKPDERVVMKKEEREAPKGEITDTKAARFARMFEKPSSDRQFDPTHDPSNVRNFANGRGGHER